MPTGPLTPPDPDAEVSPPREVPRKVPVTHEGQIKQYLLDASQAPDHETALTNLVLVESIFEDLEREGTILGDLNLYILFLQKLREAAAHERGVKWGERFFVLFSSLMEREDSIENELLLGQIVDEAGIMQYYLSNSASRDNDTFEAWADRGQNVIERLDDKLPVLDALHGEMNFGVRIEIVTMQLKLILLKARTLWRRAQFFETGEKHCEMAGRSYNVAQNGLNRDREERHLSAEPQPIEVTWNGMLTGGEGREFRRTAAELRALCAMLLGLAYSWKPHLGLDFAVAKGGMGFSLFENIQMSDANSAELVMGLDFAYMGIISPPSTSGRSAEFEEDHNAARLFEKFFAACHSDSDLFKSPTFWYAQAEKIRQLKIIGQHAHAHSVGTAVEQATRTDYNKDARYYPHLLNTIADNLIALGHKLRMVKDQNEEKALVGEAVAILGMPANTPRLALMYRLFKDGYEWAQKAISASRGVENCADRYKVARDTSADAAISMLPYVPLTADSQQEKIRLIKTVWASFRNEERESGGAVSEDPLVLFFEAPALCMLANQAQELLDRAPELVDRGTGQKFKLPVLTEYKSAQWFQRARIWIQLEKLAIEGILGNEDEPVAAKVGKQPEEEQAFMRKYRDGRETMLRKYCEFLEEKVKSMDVWLAGN